MCSFILCNCNFGLGLFSSIFRDTDLVPSDIIAGFVLLRVKQKRESREQRRIELLAEQRLKYTSGTWYIIRVFIMYIQ